MKSKFFNGIEYSAYDWAEYFGSIYSNGILNVLKPGETEITALKVIKGSGMSIVVSSGAMFINGYQFMASDDILNFATTGASARIDRVVVRLDLETIPQGIQLYIKQGSNIPPTLERSNNIHEMSLATVNIPAGSSTLINADITDDRTNPELCGIASFFGDNNQSVQIPDYISFPYKSFELTSFNETGFLEFDFDKIYNKFKLIINAKTFDTPVSMLAPFPRKTELILYKNIPIVTGISTAVTAYNESRIIQAVYIDEKNMSDTHILVNQWGYNNFSARSNSYLNSLEMIQNPINFTTKIKISGSSDFPSPGATTRFEPNFYIQVDCLAWE